MNVFDRKGLKQEAAERLTAASYSPRMLMLIYMGVSLGTTLLVAVLSYILEQKIGTTGGLSGIGLRSTLTTAQSFLQLVVTLLLPFWEIGVVFAAIRLAREQTADPTALSAGFRRFGPVLRLNLLQLILCSLLAMPCMYVSVGIFGATPLSGDFQALMMPYVEKMMTTGETTALDTAAIEEMMRSMLPLIPIFIVVFLAALTPIIYRLRLAEYVIMDQPACSALQAMLTSWRMTKGRVMALFRLDLSFWWFYALQALATALAYCDQLLTLAGITLPISADGAYFLFYGLYALGELGIYCAFGSRLYTTYALFYDALRENAADRFV